MQLLKIISNCQCLRSYLSTVGPKTRETSGFDVELECRTTGRPKLESLPGSLSRLSTVRQRDRDSRVFRVRCRAHKCALSTANKRSFTCERVLLLCFPLQPNNKPKMLVFVELRSIGRRTGVTVATEDAGFGLSGTLVLGNTSTL